MSEQWVRQKLTAEFLSAAHLGSGSGGGGIDALVARDRHGRPVIWASHVEDVLRVRPGLGPCLACVFDLGRFGGADDEISGQQQALRDTPAYVPPHAVDARIQPGLATDIAPISNMLARLALVELSRGTGSSIASLEHDLEADLYLWANRREESYEAWAPMGFRMNELSVLRWYGVRARRNPSCVECGDGLRAAALRGGQVGIIDGPPPVWG